MKYNSQEEMTYALFQQEISIPDFLTKNFLPHNCTYEQEQSKAEQSKNMA